MNKGEVEKIIDKAINNLLTKQLDIFEFTSQTNQTEWNLAHHLANEIHVLVPFFDCDLDIAKPNLGNKRPDMVFHKRGVHKYNFLVVEMKRDDVGGLVEDKQKIYNNWFHKPLCYQFGAIVNINSDKTYFFEVFENNLPKERGN